jgi:hypothetical protein
LGCLVAHDVGLKPPKRTPDGRAVSDIEMVEQSLFGHVGSVSRGEVVEDEYLVSAPDGRVGNMTADEAGSSCNNDSHCRLLVPSISFNRDAFREIARTIDVPITCTGCVVGQHL